VILLVSLKFHKVKGDTFTGSIVHSINILCLFQHDFFCITQIEIGDENPAEYPEKQGE
jgi:hypothetical protein